ncbi:DUF4129 domain-containing protein [Chitinivorax sp. PXF-14]|uniref:DUF4129 domain-containing protein n=1 Tax=Chitinivorax sp. PXF-14 TaxID=3230488 RepID=UPI003467031F
MTTTRRQLHMGRLVSVVMVIFAASHDRADWTMLFYLVPYVVAVVFTLVSEQIGRRAQHVRAGSLKDTGLAGQGAAATVATVMILALAGLLYALTPQASWPYLASKYGQKSVLGRLDESDFADASRQGGAGSGDGNASQRDGGNEWDEALSPWRGWPTPGGMREAATKKGMPVWQSSAIRRMADISDTLEPAWASVSATLADQLKRMGQWLKDNLEAILRSLFALLLILLAAGMVAMFRDIRTAAWLRTRFDYLYIARLKRHAAGRRGAIQFYRAMERLFALHDAPRAKTANTREFLSQAVSSRRPMQAAATELTLLFERFRYGVAEPDARQLARMRELYAELFRKAGE